MRRSFLEHLLSVESDDHFTSYAATDDDLPRNLWPGEQEPLIRVWQEAGEREFHARQLEIPRCEPECVASICACGEPQAGAGRDSQSEPECIAAKALLFT